MPCCFTRSYSERCVRRRAFENENEPTFVVCIGQDFYPEPSCLITRSRFVMHHFSTKEVFPRNRAEDFSRKRTSASYCPGDPAGVSVVPAGDSLVAAGASDAAGLVSVAGAVVGAGVVAGAAVSVFSSHAARSAAPARMQMYFFIIGDAYCFN